MVFKRGKKVMAIVLALLMIVGIMPTDFGTSKVDAAIIKNSINITDGLTAGTTYGDQSILKLSVLEDMGFKASTATVDNVDYTGYIQGTNNAAPKGGAVPTAGAAFKIEAVKNCSITFVMKAATKVYHVVEVTAANPTGTDIKTGSAVDTGDFIFDMTAGNTYYFYLDGSKACVYGISYGYSDYQVEKLDITSGLTAGTDYFSTSGIATLNVLENMGFKASTATLGGVDYTGYIQGTNNAAPKGGAVPTAGAAFKITATKNSSIVFVMKEAAKTYHVVEVTPSNPTGTDFKTGTAVAAGDLKFDMVAGNTYYFYLDGSKACVYGITLTTGTPDVDWSTVAAPTLDTPSADGAKISVPYTASIGSAGGEKLVVNMYKGTDLVDTQISKAEGTSGIIYFNPASSGDYTFKATLCRSGQTDKESNEVSTSYTLPLVKPVISTVTSKGAGKVEVAFSAVPEADSYVVAYSADGTTYTDGATVTSEVAVVTVPSTGKNYSFKVTAKRGSTESITSDVVEQMITADSQVTWNFSAFGQGVSSSTDDCGYSGSATDGSVTVWDLNNKGKIVPASTDGLSFYYTAIPSSKNFTLKAKVTIDKWTYTNGQEGFGLMACDRVGTNGDASVFWNNSYMDTITKVEYFADADGNITDDINASKISMKLGIGSQQKVGVTKDNLSLLQANDADAINNQFSTKLVPLESSAATLGAGTYNIVGNATAAVEGTISEKTSFIMTIQKNNTGYFVSYTDENGVTTTKKYYDTSALSKLDEDNVYAGFFASRTAKATFSDISLTTIDPTDDAPAEEQPVTQVTPTYQVVSGSVANSDNYTLSYVANANGHVYITDANGSVIADQDVEAGKKYSFNTGLALGQNKFNITMTPDAGYKPSEFEELSSYEPVTFTQTVTYNNFSGDIIYVGPDATSSGKGTKENPIDIYTAAKYAAPGQSVILLPGTYNLTSTVKIERGVNGTAEKPIYMIADPDSTERPVLDFGGNCEGFVIAGNYWYIQGFDVTNSANGKDGIRLSGSNCTMDNMHTYHNGNTGLQISRYLSTDLWDDWPANNLVLNCTSYGNADAGYEDADGFSAKLTVADGNVFDGCISYNNADDGWDLFAKPETGKIGSVTIKNCVAFGNGYLEDGTDAGNGNGFKLGGSSLSGYHKLINCVSFDNKAKGIDSNSCPDIQVTNCTTYNNGSFNVAFYTNDAANTDFMGKGILSYRTQFTTVDEQFKFKGTQDPTKVYQATDYYWNCTEAGTNNSNGTVTNAWFVSTDTLFDYTTHKYSATPITRNSDNTINMNGILVLSDTAKAIVGTNTGAFMTGSASKIIKPTGDVTGGLLWSPKTGDSMNMILYLLLLLAAAGCIAVVAVKSKKRA